MLRERNEKERLKKCLLSQNLVPYEYDPSCASVSMSQNVSELRGTRKNSHSKLKYRNLLNISSKIHDEKLSFKQLYLHKICQIKLKTKHFQGLNFWLVYGIRSHFEVKY